MRGLQSQAVKRDLVGSAVRCAVDTVAPVSDLSVHVFKRCEGSAEEKIAFHEADRVLNLPFGLGAVGFTEFRHKPVVSEEIFELWVPLVVVGAECSLEDHGFDVVIQDLISVATEIFKGVEVAFEQGVDIGGEVLCCITILVVALPSRTSNQTIIAIILLYPFTLIRISRNIPFREVARTPSPKIRFMAEKTPLTFHRFP